MAHSNQDPKGKALMGSGVIRAKYSSVGGTFLGALLVILTLPSSPMRDWEKFVYAQLWCSLTSFFYFLFFLSWLELIDF
jgi:hypothetical protein